MQQTLYEGRALSFGHKKSIRGYMSVCDKQNALLLLTLDAHLPTCIRRRRASLVAILLASASHIALRIEPNLTGWGTWTVDTLRLTQADPYQKNQHQLLLTTFVIAHALLASLAFVSHSSAFDLQVTCAPPRPPRSARPLKSHHTPPQSRCSFPRVASAPAPV